MKRSVSKGVIFCLAVTLLIGGVQGEGKLSFRRWLINRRISSIELMSVFSIFRDTKRNCLTNNVVQRTKLIPHLNDKRQT